MKTYFSALFLCFVLFSSIAKAADKPLIYKINLKKEIGSTTWLYVQNGLREATELDADGILIHMNTYGGAVVFADSIRTALLNSQIPVYVFIDNNAASAGALIAVACDSIYMRKGATIGAASVVNESGEKMPDKYQSYMRATIRATAEAHGKDTIMHGKERIVTWRRDPIIAEAFVDEYVQIPGIVDSTHILTFTVDDAIKYGYCEGIAETPDEIITKLLHYPQYTMKEYRATAFDEVKGFLTNPALQVIFIMLIIGGIYFELQTPGMGFPSIIAVAAAVLYFTPLYIDGLAEHWEIAVFIIGLILIVLEIFVIPGFGIAGVSGIVMMIGSLSLALINNVEFDFSGVSGNAAGSAVFEVFAGLVLSVIAITWLSSRIGAKGFFQKLALEATQQVSDGYISVSQEPAGLIGKTGITKTVLRPSGTILVDGELYDAVSELGFIDKGVSVLIVKYETGQVYVEIEYIKN
ncbi:MAG: nodulation protein NfeD [Bacteroidales bacterium]|jgi:membrane-bound serine protease (ClpP class)|nr:nodulation protein NfeD [Bacteroidales bacterium]